MPFIPQPTRKLYQGVAQELCCRSRMRLVLRILSN